MSRVAAVDIGTNTVRLLVASAGADGDLIEEHLRVEIVGLGHGLDATGRLSTEAMARAEAALAGFAPLIEGVNACRVVATSASRDAANRDEFFERVEAVLGTRPTLISGDEEAGYAFAGATSWLDESQVVVVDIGGGSTEFVAGRSHPEYSMSVDIGSVRLTDRLLASRPVDADVLDAAARMVADAFAAVHPPSGTVIGVAGTCTSAAALAAGLAAYDRDVVHGFRLGRRQVAAVVERLAGLSIEATAALPSLEPKRAPVILGGTVVLAGVYAHLGIEELIVSERDMLHGVALAVLSEST